MKNGCKYHWDCDTCPFPDCIEGIDIERRGKKEELKGLVKARIKDGQSPTRIARELGISTMSVSRYRRA